MSSGKMTKFDFANSNSLNFRGFKDQRSFFSKPIPSSNIQSDTTENYRKPGLEATKEKRRYFCHVNVSKLATGLKCQSNVIIFIAKYSKLKN